MDELKLPTPRLTVVIVDDAQMSQLHSRYAGAKGTTDVLTFDLSEPQPSGSKPQASPDGEIYICVDEARRRAAEFGHQPRLELLLYAVHGLLHLLGYDDHTARGFRKMHAMEDRLLQAIGVGPVFSRRAAT